jgi:hypothetical protein
MVIIIYFYIIYYLWRKLHETMDSPAHVALAAFNAAIIVALMDLILIAEDAKKKVSLAYKSEKVFEEQALATHSLLYHYHLSVVLRDDELKTILEQRETDCLNNASNACEETNRLMQQAQDAGKNVLSKIKQILGVLSHEEIREQIMLWDNTLIYWYVLYLWEMKHEQQGPLSLNKECFDHIFTRLTSILTFHIEKGTYPRMNDIQRDITILENDNQEWIESGCEVCPISRITIVILKEVMRRAAL